MQTSINPIHQRQLGFSLPEIMVGMVIGLLGIIIIMQVTSVFEGQKRTTSSGDDAQNGGAIALYTLQREIAQAGYGFSSTNLIGKNFITPFITFGTSSPLAAVVLNHGDLSAIADDETDTFIVIYGNSNATPEGAVIVNSNPAPYTIIGGAAESGVAAVGSGGHGFSNGDYVTVDDGSGNGGVSDTHYLLQVTGVAAGAVPVTSSNGYPIPPYQDTPAGPHPTLYNFGPSPSILAYAVVNGSLSVCDYLIQDCSSNAAAWLPLTGGIVSMRTQCVGGTSLRVALVARNTQPAPTVVTTVTPTWSPNGVSAPVATAPETSWATTNGVAWDHYRYKTFETIVPIRNAIWKGVAGC